MLQKLLFLLITANVIAYFWFDYHAAQTRSEHIKQRQQYAVSEAQPGHQQLYLQSERQQHLEDKEPVNNSPACFSVAFRPVLLAANSIEQRELALREIESALINEGFETQLVWQQAEVLRGYLIYLPPTGGAQQAKSKLDKLKQQGIDAFMFTSGELAHGISLGLYQQLKGAEAAVQRFTELGYEAKLKSHSKLQRWPQLQAGDASGLGDVETQRLEQLLQNITGNYADLLIASKRCEGVAHRPELE